MLEKVEASYSKFKTYHTLLGEYYADFGQYDSSTERGLETLRALPQESKETLNNSAAEVIDAIMSYKQIDENRAYEALKNKVKMELSAQALEHVNSESQAMDSLAKPNQESQKEIIGQPPVLAEPSVKNISVEDGRNQSHLASKMSFA